VACDGTMAAIKAWWSYQTPARRATQITPLGLPFLFEFLSEFSPGAFLTQHLGGQLGHTLFAGRRWRRWQRRLWRRRLRRRLQRRQRRRRRHLWGGREVGRHVPTPAGATGLPIWRKCGKVHNNLSDAIGSIVAMNAPHLVGAYGYWKKRTERMAVMAVGILDPLLEEEDSMDKLSNIPYRIFFC
jgi:hypothetical protein